MYNMHCKKFIIKPDVKKVIANIRWDKGQRFIDARSPIFRLLNYVCIGKRYLCWLNLKKIFNFKSIFKYKNL